MLLKKPPEFWTNKPLGNPGRFRLPVRFTTAAALVNELMEARDERRLLRLRATGFDAVKHLLLCRIEKRPPKLDMSSYPYLPRADVETTSAASYMALLVEAAE